MRKITLSLMLFASITLTGMAQKPNLEGFHYGITSAPAGNEWESVENLSLNKEQPRAYFFSFQDVESARRMLPENSKYWLSLNGDWKFNWAPDPNSRPKNFFDPTFDVSSWDNLAVPSSWNIAGIQKDGSLKYGVPIYVNQPVIFMHDRRVVGDWKGGVMRTPPPTWTTYKHRNEVGSFRRTFDVPADWNGREVFLSFDGVDSFFYLWVNGKYVGFSKNSRNAARFDITPYLQKGENVLAVEVYRSSDGSFLEAQDMFRLPGIFRTVALYSTPKVFVRNVIVKPDLDATYTDGKLNITTDVKNLTKKEAKGYTVDYTLYANKLYSDENSQVSDAKATTTVVATAVGATTQSSSVMAVKAPKLWSAEYPNMYTLVGELKDAKGKVVEVFSTKVGLRKVEIKDTPASEDEFGLAGRYYYINGKPAKLKGVNRHETNPAVGHAITRKMMENEIMLMKRANINHVRNSHYPPDPYWFYLCDKYGIYLEDEANIESHQYYYGKESLSHPVEWRKAHVARVLEMTYSTINNPSVVIWSLGNEAGPGQNFVEAYNELKKVDTTRPVQYERNNSIVDMGSNQYPSIGWMNNAVTGKADIKYPFHVSEYAHSMGNACGNLVDYWIAIESTNFFCGGAIWDWVDQAMYNYDPKTGIRYLAYGGDFGDTPNDGQFVMNGIVFADLEPKPQYFEVKKVYQHIGVTAKDISKSQFEVFNKYYYKDLSCYDVEWSLLEDGKRVKSGVVDMPKIAARGKALITVPYNMADMSSDSEYFVKLQFLLKCDMPWAKKGYVQAEEQILISEATERPKMVEVAKSAPAIQLSESKSGIETVKGEGFEVRFDMNAGTIYSLTYGADKVITDGNGPKLNALRAFVNNDNWVYEPWFANGLHNLKHKVLTSNTKTLADGRVVLSFTVESQAPNGAKILGGTSSGKNSIVEQTDRKFGSSDFKFTTNQVWTVYKDGSIELQSSITSNRPDLILPRLGYLVRVPKNFDKFTYYGRGPIDNYADRKVGQMIEQHNSNVKNEFVNFPKPQDMGNHEDVRWCALTNNGDKGVVFVADNRLSAAALPYSALDMILAPHPYQLPAVGETYLTLDCAVTGLGGYSCGQGGPLEKDRVKAGLNTMGFIIRPAQSDLTAVARVSLSGELPISITQNKIGEVTISSKDKNAAICYSINGGKAQDYSSPVAMRGGGELTAWYKANPDMKTKISFEKIESVQTEVIYASSEESGEGAKNLVDGDPNTIWHTMYSVTVAKHPHWVDFDMGDVKNIKGFTYLPRQDGPNGNIKDYTIQVSMDGKNWGEPVMKSAFARNLNEKRVMLPSPVKARYLRFTALSEQSGQDFATGAEFAIIAD